jgi:hypothetical protein
MLAFPGGIVPLGRVDPVAVSAMQNLPLPNCAGGNSASGGWTDSGTLPAGGHFAISNAVLTQLETFGSFVFGPGNHTPGNLQVASEAVSYTLE